MISKKTIEEHSVPKRKVMKITTDAKKRIVHTYETIQDAAKHEGVTDKEMYHACRTCGEKINGHLFMAY